MFLEPFLNYLVDEPHGFGDLLNKSIHMVMTTYLQKRDDNIQIRLDQIYVLKECENFPTTEKYNLFSANNIVRQGLVHFTGVLTGYSDIQKSM